jgi:hypothetical protein
MKKPLLISLTSLESRTGIHRASIRRWMVELGFEPIKRRSAANTKVYFRTRDAEAWLKKMGL